MKNGSNVIIERYVLFEGIEMIEYRFWHNYSYSICQQIAIYWYNISFTIKSIIHGYIRSFWLYANLIVYQVLEAGRILIFCEDFFFAISNRVRVSYVLSILNVSDDAY
jgi:hypothetical protein